MAHRLDADFEVVLASENYGKVVELNDAFSLLNLTIVPQSMFRVPSVEETGLSFVENAILKARNAASHTGKPALADDSGLEVDYLQGAPGIFSARFAGAKATDQTNMAKLLDEMRGVPWEERSARFQCVLVYMRHAQDPTPLIAQGSWEGFIAESPQGQEGFGYDPVFHLPYSDMTAACLSKEEKNQISHRAKAVKQMLYMLKGIL